MGNVFRVFRRCRACLCQLYFVDFNAIIVVSEKELKIDPQHVCEGRGGVSGFEVFCDSNTSIYNILFVVESVDLHSLLCSTTRSSIFGILISVILKIVGTEYCQTTS